MLTMLGVFTSVALAEDVLVNGKTQESDTYLVYDVYAGGIHVLEAELSITVDDGDRYYLYLDTHTRGFLGTLVPWKGVFKSDGWLIDGLYKPEFHESATTWRGTTKTKSYSYDKDGTFKALTIHEDGRALETKDVDKALTDQTTDVLSSTFNVMTKIATGETCDSSEDIFDGKRRFTKTFQSVREEELNPSSYNVFTGLAERCTVEVQPAGGNWHKRPRGWLSIQEQGRMRGTLPTVWFAKLEEEGMPVPVRILIKTQFGSLFLHLAEYRAGETIKKSEYRSSE